MHKVSWNKFSSVLLFIYSSNKATERFQEMWSRKNEFLTIRPWQTACQKISFLFTQRDRQTNKKKSEKVFPPKTHKILKKNSAMSSNISRQELLWMRKEEAIKIKQSTMKITSRITTHSQSGTTRRKYRIKMENLWSKKQKNVFRFRILIFHVSFISCVACKLRWLSSTVYAY